MPLDQSPPPLRVTWLVPDDRGGGVVSVAQSGCLAARAAGAEATLLLMRPPTGHAAAFSTPVASLAAAPPFADVPERLLRWLDSRPQDVLLLNGCEETDAAIPWLPAATRVVYVVHDTAARYFRAALKHEAALDGIVAVSETVARRFRHRLADPRKLAVVHNGTHFPQVAPPAGRGRTGDIVFLGGDNGTKGAGDVLALWPSLRAAGFTGRLHWFGHVGPRMERRIAALPDAGAIALHGRTPRRAVFAALGSAGAALILSRVEPFGMATIEAMGMGAPVVAWDIETGTREIVAAGEGAFVPLGAYRELAAAVMDRIAMPEAERIAMAHRVRAGFGSDALWRRTEPVLRAAMAGPSARRPAEGSPVPLHVPPRRLVQRLPAPLRRTAREWVARSPRIAHALRDLRGY